MTTRTWVKGLKLVLLAAKHYATRWQAQLRANMTDEQYTCLVSVIAALSDCINLLPDTEIGP